ncbi:MAG: isochorismatase family protein [Chloroflexi bacterium]|nr:isochorismatase family protein [Chloroflexota bacterium]
MYQPLGKMAFSCCSDEGFVEKIDALKRDTLVLAGMETHVCVQQTALEALSLGYKVHVVADAVTSRRREDWGAAIDKLRHAGAIITTTEMVAYEWIGRAGTPEFKGAMPYLKW